MSGPTGNYSLGFSGPSLTGATSNTIALSAGSGSNLGITTQPSSTAQNTVAFPQQPVIQLRDAANNPVAQANVVVTAAINSGGGTLGGTASATTNASGVATFANLSITGTAGSRTLLFAANGYVSVASNPINVTAGPATKITVTTQPAASAQSGVPFTQQPVVQLRDVSDNAVSQSLVNITAAITSGGGTMGGTATVATNASGVATFAGLSITGTIGDRTLSFSSGVLDPAVSNPITLTAGPASQLTITTQPSATATSGTVFVQQPVIQLRDGAGNAVSQSGVMVTASVTSGPSATLGGTVTVSTNGSGVATYINLMLTGTAGSYTLGFAATGLTGATSSSITLSTSTASRLSITTQPSSTAQSGIAFGQQPAIQLRDASDNPVSQNGVVVTAAIASGGGTLGGTVTATTNGSGLATFTNLSITGTVGDHTLSFTAPSFTGVTSSTIALAAGAAAIIAANSVTTQTATVNTAVGAPPSVRVTDASSNAVAAVPVTFTLTAGGGSLSPSSPATINTDASGIATLTSWTLGSTAGSNNNTVTATATGLTGSPVTFTASGTAGTPTQITYVTQPSGATNGVAFTTQPVLLVRDANNNNVPGAVVTAVISTAPAGSSNLIGSGTATTASNGRATFSGLGLIGPIGNYKLRFSTNAGALTSNESNTISLAAGAAAIITANSATTQSATVSTAVSAPPSVKVTDTGGNPKGSIAVTFTVTVTAGGGSLSPASPATINTNSSGIATVTSWTLGSTAGTNNNTVTATATGLTGSPVTFTASGTAGAPTQLTYNTQPSTTANSGAAFASQPVLLLRDAANNPVGSTPVTATITGSPAGVAFVGSPTAMTNGSGVATFLGLGLSGPVGSYTLTFASGAANSGASNTIALSAGAPTQLTYNAQPPGTATSGTPFSAPPALLLQDAADNPVGSTLVTATITTSPGGGSFVGTPSATTNASGVATFAGLGLSGPVGNYKLTFTSGAATSAASSTIALSAGIAANITANSPTSQSATVGTPVAAPPSVKVTDAAGNPKAGVSVTFTMMAGGGTTVPASPATLTTDAGGVASLTSWVLGPTAGTNNNTVTATSTGLTGSPVTFTASGTAGAPTQMAITQQPSATATSNTVFAQQPIIQVTDANGNPVSGVSVTAAIQTGTGGTLGGTITQVTDSSGNATFTDLKITGLLTYTLRFSATGPPPVDSNIIIVSL